MGKNKSKYQLAADAPAAFYVAKVGTFKSAELTQQDLKELHDKGCGLVEKLDNTNQNNETI